MNYRQQAIDRGIPFPTAYALENYIQRGTAPGAFLEAVVCNDYRRAYLEADDRNQQILHHIMGYMLEVAPLTAWGDTVAFEYWTAKGGIDGLLADHGKKMKGVKS